MACRVERREHDRQRIRGYRRDSSELLITIVEGAVEWVSDGWWGWVSGDRCSSRSIELKYSVPLELRRATTEGLRRGGGGREVEETADIRVGGIFEEVGVDAGTN